MKWKQVLACIGLAILCAVPVSADSSGTGCLFDLSTRIGPDSQVTVATIRDKIFNGRLTSIDLTNQTLSIVHTGYDSAWYTFGADELRMIRYREEHGFKAGWSIVGFLGGAVAGFGIGVLIAAIADEEEGVFLVLLTVPAGAVLGFILGSTIPARDRDVTLKCP